MFRQRCRSISTSAIHSQSTSRVRLKCKNCVVALLTAEQQLACGAILEQKMCVSYALLPILLLYQPLRRGMNIDDDAVRKLCEHTSDGKWAALFAALKMDMQPRHFTRSAGPTHKNPRSEDAGERIHYVKQLRATDSACKDNVAKAGWFLVFACICKDPNAREEWGDTVSLGTAPDRASAGSSPCTSDP